MYPDQCLINPWQEALAEKTQHVEQLLRERDMERSELARLAAQADEATRSALEMKTQLAKVWKDKIGWRGGLHCN